MDSNLAHSVRNSLRDKETAFTLGDDALDWDTGSEQGSISYREIDQLNLITYGTDAADPEVVHGQLTLRTGSGASLKLRSHHLKGLGSYENRAATYVPFVRDLIRRVQGANPEARFVSGSSGLKIVWLVIAVLVGLVALALGLAVIAEGFRVDIASGGLLAAFLAWTSFRRFQNYSAATFDPADPPAELLDL